MKRRLGTTSNREGMRRFIKEGADIHQRLLDGEFYDVIADEYGISRTVVYKYFPANKLNEIHFDKDEHE